MRTNDNNRAEKYIKKHVRFKRWVAFAIILSFLTGTATLYGLNKPATAMTEDGAKKVGLVLETADSEWENGMIEDMNDSEIEETLQDAEGTSDAEKSDAGASESSDETELTNEKDEESLSDTEASDEEASSENSSDEEAADEASTEEDAADKASTEEDVADKASTDENEADEKDQTEASKESSKAGESVAELKKDVVITVLYEDNAGEPLADSKELSISESFNLSEEVRSFDGYHFDKGTIGENQITELTKKTKETTVTVDAGEASEAAEESTDEESTDEENTDSAAAESETEDNKAEDSKESVEQTVTYTYYEAKTVAGDVIDITEDAELHLSYYKVNTQTEFTYTDDSKVTVKAVLSDPNALPDGIQLMVSEVTAQTEGYNYDAYMQALNDNAEAIADEAGHEEASEYTDTNTLMYDIAFMFEGKEYEPAEGTVSISIEFKENQLSNELAASSEEDITVVHLPVKTEVMESPEISSTQEATEISSEDIEVKTLADASAEVGGSEKIEFVSESFSIFAVTVYQKHEPGTDDFKSVLGDAVNFGIVADQLGMKESETNFATNRLYAIDQQYGNDLTNAAEQTFIAASTVGNVRIKGFPAYFIVPGQYAWNISHMSGADYLKFDIAYSTGELNEIVNDMLTYAKSASKDLASRQDNISLLTYYEGNTPKYFVDTTKYAAGTYYVTLTDNDFKNKLYQEGNLKIYKRSDQVIVFNVTARSDINLYKYSVSTDLGPLYDGATLANSNKYDSVTQSIIWNFENTKNVNTSGSVAGVFISGQDDATFINSSTSAGWIVFPNVIICSGEWHNTYTDVKQISGTAQFQAYKNVDGQFAETNGFSFALYRKNSSAADGWEKIGTAKNGFLPNRINNTSEQETTANHNVIFSPITYGNKYAKRGETDSFGNLIYQYTSIRSEGESETFVYKIVETEGTTDSEGNVYIPDTTVYYAKVTVTVQLKNYCTKSLYYRVSAPEYYKDEACTIPCGEIPSFDNKTTKGSVGISLYKYLNGEDPGELSFDFTVRALNTNGAIDTLTTDLKNSGSNISYSFDYDSRYLVDGRIYLIITENDIKNNSSGVSITKDTNYIFVRVDNPGTDAQEVRYYRAAANDGYVQRIEDNSGWNANKKSYVQTITKGSKYFISPENHASCAAFYNTGSSNLRIHKMVVNDYGSGFVRDNTKTALLSNVMFRITNNATGNYIVFKGFTGHAGDTGEAIEYDASTHKITGNKYVVTYNQSAQWTITAIPAGTYTVDEVADGLTMSYDPASNTSSVIESTNLSRVTKYGLTEDAEEVGNDKWKIGGNNWRAVFAVDVDGLNDLPPANVKVGSTDINNPSHTQTVQVCNFYSIPIGPLQVSKNFAGGVWDENMQFTFKIEPTGYSAYTSERNSVTLASQPMPTVSVKNGDGSYNSFIQDTVTVTGADAVRNEDGTYTAVAQFASIPYRYEGDYYYKITEVNTGIDGIKYDENTYYVKVTVSKKWTWFNKTYSYENMTHPAKYTRDTTLKEHFYYLGADVTYAADENFNDVLAICSLTLNSQPDTSLVYNNQFVADYSLGSVYDVDFNNTLTGNLTVSKVWVDTQGSDIADKRTSLTLDVWQKTADTPWVIYGTVQLSTSNNWTQTISNLPIYDEYGNLYQYSVKESDQYLGTYRVGYTYNGITVNANSQGDITVGEGTVKDTGYVMTIGADGKSYGEVVITNESVYVNTLPSTGGAGTTPFAAAGLVLIVLALTYSLRFKVFSLKKK